MARNTTLAAFFATVAVAVPAGWHTIDATIQTDGKHLRPMQQSFTVDGVKVTLDVDRNLVTTGDPVTAKLVAYSDTPRQIVVDLRVTQSHNYEGERVETPTVTIDHEKLVLTATPKGGPPVKSRIVLGTRPERSAMVDDFRIYVSPHVKKPAKRADGTDAPDAEPDASAAIAVRGWSGDSLDMSIERRGPITGDAPFTVVVRVKNTTGHRLPHAPYIQLGTQVGLAGGIEAGEDFEITEIDDPARPDDDYSTPLRRGAVTVQRFTVMPKKPGLEDITFVATSSAWDGQPGPVIAGATAVRTFKVTQPVKTVAVK
jgi:hypothetical protein